MSRQIQLLVSNSMVAANLRYLMRQKVIGQNELARKTGVKQPTISKILMGKNYVPRDSTLGLLAKFFGITLEHLRYQNLSDQSVLPVNLRGYRIPMLNSKIAGLGPVPENWPDSITVYFEVSQNAFAMDVSDNAMEPTVTATDIVVVDTARFPQPGQYAAARTDDAERAFVRKYKALPEQGKAKRPFELVPLSDFYPVIRSGDASNARVLGTVVAYWRKLV